MQRCTEPRTHTLEQQQGETFSQNWYSFKRGDTLSVKLFIKIHYMEHRAKLCIPRGFLIKIMHLNIFFFFVLSRPRTENHGMRRKKKNVSLYVYMHACKMECKSLHTSEFPDEKRCGAGSFIQSIWNYILYLRLKVRVQTFALRWTCHCLLLLLYQEYMQ